MSQPAFLDDLFAYEAAIESAWKAILSAAPASLNARVEFEDGTRVWPVVDVQLRGAVPFGQGAPHRHIAPDKSIWFDAWEGTVTSTVCTVRGKNSSQQARILGNIRRRGQQWQHFFTEAVLPYHQVLRFEETDLSRGVDPETREDKSVLSHRIIFQVREHAWRWP